jgi:seryl-tRNA synthetase
MQIPNEMDPSVPISKDEADNGLVREWGDKRPSDPSLCHHHEVGGVVALVLYLRHQRPRYGSCCG